MQPSDQDRSYLWDMREYAQKVVEIVGEATFEEIGANSILRLALERAFEIIGEAARHISPQFRADHPEIPWRDIVGQRNVLVHEYGEIDPALLWQTATVDAPRFIEAIDRVMPN